MQRLTRVAVPPLRTARLSSRAASNSSNVNPQSLPEAQHHNCALDNETLYVSEDIAKALGWKPDQDPKGLSLTLHGWAPGYFAIAPTGSDSGTVRHVRTSLRHTDGPLERLAKSTVESSRNPLVQSVLADLKDK